MEEKRGDNNNGERQTTSEQLTRHQNRSYTRRPLSIRTSEFSPTDQRTNRRTTLSIIDDDQRSQTINRHSDRLPTQMKSLSLHYISNPSLADSNHYPQQTLNSTHHDDEHNDETRENTYSFRREFNKLRTAKSQGELYYPHAPLPLPPMTHPNPDDHEIKQRTKYPPESSNPLTPTRTRAQSSAVQNAISSHPNSSDEPSNSHKLPIWKRLKKIITPSKKNKDPTRKESSGKVPNLQLDEIIPNETNRTVPDSIANGTTTHLLQNPIKLTELRTWLTSRSFPEQRIRDEYDKLPTDALHPKTLAFRPENRSKNRFNAIEPYDHSRVVLRRLSTDPSSDYINASYIDGYRSTKVYIAAQAPTDSTLYDFLRMICQLRIQSIIMVTRLFEDGKHKCVQYWPDESEKRVNDIHVRLENEEKYADYTIRRLNISNTSEPSEVFTVKQYHFLSWPDHGCLSLCTPLLDFRQRFRADHRSNSPILVHCSAGVGRSGTFIALDALLETAEHEDTIDVLEFTHRMRQNRVYMIQTAEQYVFLYRSLIEGILTMGSAVSLQEFITTRRVPMDPKTQYRLLEQLQSNIEYTYRGALDPSNLNKNRFESILAPDNSRPYLMTQVEKTTDYINAVFVNSYRQSPSYIVTQYPLPHTSIDFWRLVYDHNVSIIMLIETIPRDAKTVPYWSSTIGQSTPFGPFELVMTSQKEDEYLIERVFDLKCIHKSVYTNDRTRMIRQFQVKENSDLLFVIKRFLKEMRTYNEQNVILQCLNGVTWSGYFAALCNLIDKMQSEHLVDPFKIVRLLRAVRPQFIDQNQYETLFSAMFDYAQKYLSATLSSRSAENSSVNITSNGHESSSVDSRVIQRL